MNPRFEAMKSHFVRSTTEESEFLDMEEGLNWDMGDFWDMNKTKPLYLRGATDQNLTEEERKVFVDLKKDDDL